jgi:hypothetical protein
MRTDADRAKIHGCIFAWVSGNLILSIIRTISTSPGSIPDDREWDMATDTEVSGEEDALLEKTKRDSE